MSAELGETPCLPCSVGTGHPQDMLANIVEGHLLRDWRNLVQADLAVEALDIKLAGIAKATKSLHCMIHGVTAGLGCEELGDVRLCAAGQALVVQPGRLEVH